jgi:hypothetical protein
MKQLFFLKNLPETMVFENPPEFASFLLLTFPAINCYYDAQTIRFKKWERGQEKGDRCQETGCRGKDKGIRKLKVERNHSKINFGLRIIKAESKTFESDVFSYFCPLYPFP